MRIYRWVGIATAAGAKGIAEAHGSVKMIDPSCIIRRFFFKLRAKLHFTLLFF